MRGLLLGLLLLAFAPRAAAQPGTIVVENQVDRSLLVWINGDVQGWVPAGGQAQFAGIPHGSLSLLAGDAQGVVASEKRSLAPGETFTWTLLPIPVFVGTQPTGVVVVVNQRDHLVDVTLNEHRFGWLGPGAARFAPRVIAGPVVATARDEAGNVVAQTTLEITPDGVARWEIPAQ